MKCKEKGEIQEVPSPKILVSTNVLVFNVFFFFFVIVVKVI